MDKHQYDGEDTMCIPANQHGNVTFFGKNRRAMYSVAWGLGVAVWLTACSSEERTRALDNPNVLPNTLAMQVCSNCHGVTGISESPNFPSLAGQSSEYLVSQLKSFKSHGRLDPEGFEYMWGISARLTDPQIEGLAAYFAAQKPREGIIGKPELQSEGKSIFEQGIAASNTPACTSCHGGKGEGMGQFPRLAGQHADYLVKQLMVFQRTDERPQGAIMKNIAHALTPQNMESVAVYLEGVK